jgi:hypothetical protein
MDRAEYDRLRAQLEKDRRARIDAAETDYQERLRALDTVWGFAQNDDGAPKDRARRRQRLFQDVSAVIDDFCRVSPSSLAPSEITLADRFCLRDVRDRLRDRGHPDADTIGQATLSSVLRRMSQPSTKRGDPVIELVEQGQGKRPSFYRVIREEQFRSKDFRGRERPDNLGPDPSPWGEL